MASTLLSTGSRLDYPIRLWGPMARTLATTTLRLTVVWAIFFILGWVEGSHANPFQLKSTQARQGMVTSAHPLASQTGVEILQAGGNAVDAAVATALVISVVEPFSAGIGGGGFLLLWQAESQEMRALDFRERAPLQASSDLYLDAQGMPLRQQSVNGHRAVAVPGTIAGLVAAHEQYGQLPWIQVVDPALRLAKDGFVVNQRLVNATRRRQSTLEQNPAAARIFLPGGQLPQVGDRLIQRDLAHTLAQVALNPQQFYTGAIAAAIHQDMVHNNGLVTRQDLRRYTATWRQPLCGPFRQVRVCSMPPPSSGGVHLLQMLRLLEGLKIGQQPRNHPETLHLLAEVMKIAYADRATYLGDPDFVSVPTAALISATYAQYRQQEIDRRLARPARQVKAVDPKFLNQLRRESHDTSHLTVVDAQRNAVSLTFTVNLGFGAGVVAAGTGIVLNNEMDDFAIAPGVPNAFGLVGGTANAIAPGKIPLSSMTPTLVTEANRLRLATGAPGGSTIITTVLQILLNVLVYDQDVGNAVAAPRIHHQWQPDHLNLENHGFTNNILTHLNHLGHNVQTRSGWGNANAIVIQPDGSLAGAADPRGDGTASGY